MCSFGDDEEGPLFSSGKGAEVKNLVDLLLYTVYFVFEALISLTNHSTNKPLHTRVQRGTQSWVFS
jgi:hypothetical protein